MNLCTKLLTNYSRLCEILLHLFWPCNCPICGRPGKIICPDCLKSLFWEEILTKNFEGLTIHSAAFYHTDINRIISAFKYSGVRALCKPVGQAMAKFFPRPSNVDYLVPVPLHINSERSYNQAYEIAKGMSEIWRINIFNEAKWAYDMKSRAGLNAEERLKLKSDAFIVPRNIHGLRVAIIDDVCTTGATLSRFSQACKYSGANVICAYTLATVSAS